MPVADGKRESPLMLGDVFHDGLDIADFSCGRSISGFVISNRVIAVSARSSNSCYVNVPNETRDGSGRVKLDVPRAIRGEEDVARGFFRSRKRSKLPRERLGALVQASGSSYDTANQRFQTIGRANIDS